MVFLKDFDGYSPTLYQETFNPTEVQFSCHWIVRNGLTFAQLDVFARNLKNITVAEMSCKWEKLVAADLYDIFVIHNQLSHDILLTS
jgi:hypothetical protein